MGGETGAEPCCLLGEGCAQGRRGPEAWPEKGRPAEEDGIWRRKSWPPETRELLSLSIRSIPVTGEFPTLSPIYFTSICPPISSPSRPISVSRPAYQTFPLELHGEERIWAGGV